MKENMDEERGIKNRNRGRENGGRRNDEERSRVNYNTSRGFLNEWCLGRLRNWKKQIKRWRKKEVW